MLYAIQAGDDGPVKLGFTAKDPAGRRRTLQTSNWEPLHVRAVWPGELADEKRLHRRFADLRLEREWFAFTPELRRFIEDRATGVEPEQPDASGVVDARAELQLLDLVRRWRQCAPRERRTVYTAESWIARVCDLAPRLSAAQLLGYLTLLEFADARGEVHINLAVLAARALGERDQLRAGRLLLELYELDLPDQSACCDWSPARRLICGIGADIPRRLRGALTPTICDGTGQPQRAYTMFEAMVSNGVASLELARYTGFGRDALPESFPAGGDFGARHAWAIKQLKGAGERAIAYRQRDA